MRNSRANHYHNHKSHGGWVENLPDPTVDFHEYGVHWTTEFTNFCFDDKRVRRVQDIGAIQQADMPMDLMLNLAIGAWEKDPDGSTVFEKNDFETDWVRVWKEK